MVDTKQYRHDYLINQHLNYLEKSFSLKSKIALVTGSARGNGKAIAEALLLSGAKVILTDILDTELKKTTNFFKNKKLPAYQFKCDITQHNEILDLKKFITKKFGRLDILVNNAGVTFPHDALDYPDDFWEKSHEVLLRAPFRLSKEFAKLMKKNHSGVIINITSINAEMAFPNNPPYVAFKGALKSLSKSLALDLGKYGIRVNSIGPGYFRTNMTKKSWNNAVLRKKRTDRTILGRWGESKDLGGTVVFLSSNASSYITGQDIYVDGGWTVKGLDA